MAQIKVLRNFTYNGNVQLAGAEITVPDNWVADQFERHGKPPEKLFSVVSGPAKFLDKPPALPEKPEKNK